MNWIFLQTIPGNLTQPGQFSYSPHMNSAGGSEGWRAPARAVKHPMAATAAALSPPPPSSAISVRPSRTSFVPVVKFPNRLRTRTLVLAAPESAFEPSNGNSPSKKSILSNLIQEIEPLDVSLIQRDVPPTTVDAMKRTISGMLGLLPSDQFQVLIEALWKPLSKLLISSMMTGYTLRNAEYRLCLERNLDMYEESGDKQKTGQSIFEVQGTLPDSDMNLKRSKQDQLKTFDDSALPDLGQVTPEAQQYILELQSRLSSVKKELYEMKRKNAALQMQQFVGEEKNELLDYLRSLEPEKVAELSEPTSSDLKETIHSVVHGLLATLSPRMHSKAPHLSENPSNGIVNVGVEEDYNDSVENASLHFHPLISLSRDYLARLLFWCMLLGHYLRGLEYRMELMELLMVRTNLENDALGGEQGQ